MYLPYNKQQKTKHANTRVNVLCKSLIVLLYIDLIDFPYPRLRVVR